MQSKSEQLEYATNAINIKLECRYEFVQRKKWERVTENGLLNLLLLVTV